MDKFDRRLIQDIMIYGTSAFTQTKRKWWNPMRYILGKIKRKRIDPWKLFVNKH